MVDVFDVAGLDKPSIRILSEEFLNQVKMLQEKNLALELLERLLAQRILRKYKVSNGMDAPTFRLH